MRLITIALISILLGTGELRSQDTTDKTAAIDSLFAPYTNTPGCAVGVFQQGKMVFSKGYGLANLEYNIPIFKETVFEAASVSKQFTAACITLLEIEGKLALGDPIQKYIPELPKFEGKTITLGNLLYQTSGLRDYLALLYGKGISWNSTMDNSKALRILSRQKGLNFEPGSQFAYSNTNYLLLAVVVERITDKSIGAFAKERFFDPLGMQHTFFYEDNRSVIKNIAIGYEREGDHYKREHYANSTTTGDGGVYITIEDFFKWNENLKKGTVGGTEFVAKMSSVEHPESASGTTYGRGFFVGDYYDINGLPTLRHSGNWAGFRSVYCRFVKQDFTVVILSNNAGTDVWRLLDQLSEVFIQDEITKASQQMRRNTPAAPNTIQLSSKRLQEFSGKYINSINGELREMTLQKDTLLYKRSNGRATKMVPITNRSFVFLGAPHVVVTFSKGSKSVTLQIGDNPPIPFTRYMPKSFTAAELKTFEGSYYNDELEVEYTLRSTNSQLNILIDGKELVRLDPISKNLCRADHFGYIRFKRDVNGNVVSFSRYDDTISQMEFIKRDS